ncbi:MAG: P-loop NTPase [Phycisphaeraceae bacterium]|nr:P-loop NTPase [Phycisphaeraceae bacterium]
MTPGAGLHPAPADQASRLRTLVGELRRTHPLGRTDESSSPLVRPPNLIAFASGKGGVGKTFLSVNLAIALAALGDQPVLLDADAGLANADVMLGVTPRQRLDRIIESEHAIGLEDVTIEAPGGVRLVPGTVGRRTAVGDDAVTARKILNACSGPAPASGLLIIDLPAGLSPLVLELMAAAVLPVVVATPDPTSIADAYALIKAMLTSARPDPGQSGPVPAVVVNQASDAEEAAKAHGRLNAVAERFLGTRLDMLGWVPWSAAAARSIRTRQPLMIGSLGSPAASQVHELARAVRVRLRPVHSSGRPAHRPSRGLFRAFLGRRRAGQSLRESAQLE